jgi:uncharacterized lipoprotein YbaY
MNRSQVAFFRASVLFIAACAAACTNDGSSKGTLSGTASFSESEALPPGAVFEATLEDVSKADAALVIARARVVSPGQSPIPFAIEYDSPRIHPTHRYAVRARIVSGDVLLFTTDQQYRVLDATGSTHVDLVLRKVPALEESAVTTPGWRETARTSPR